MLKAHFCFQCAKLVQGERNTKRKVENFRFYFRAAAERAVLADVLMCRCADVQMCGCADVQMCGCADWQPPTRKT